MQRFETKYDLLNAVYSDKELKKGAILLLQYLVHKSNKEKCFPAVETIAKALNVCRRTVQYNMRKLENAGYIIRKERWYNHQQLTNQYVFNLGVTDDKPGISQYTDVEKDTIQSSLFNNQEEQCDGFNQVNLNKAEEILKIYGMSLSGREKMLLIYLFHKANQKGLTYNSVNAITEAIGIGRRTFNKLLRSLRRKLLIKVRTMFLRGREVLLIKLTGKIYQEPVFSEATNMQNNIDIKIGDQQILQKIEMDQKLENVDYEQNAQIENRWRDETRETSFWKKIWKKCKGAIQFGLDKIRLELRL